MIPTAERVQAVLKLTDGSFEEVPFALLLHALAADRRTVTVEMGRRAVRKELTLRDGVPIQCASNLAHETLGRFLVSTGRLEETEASRHFAEAVTRGVLLGQVLLEHEVVKPDELGRLLQHNLARKLLDAFTWRDGTFAIRSTVLPLDVPMKVNVTQLILLGVSRFAPGEMIGRVTAGVIGKKLARHPSPPLAGGEPPPAASQRKVLEMLAKPARIDELMATTGLTPEELSRAAVGLLMAGLIVPAETLSPAPAVAAPPPALAAPDREEPADAELRRRVAELDMVFAMHRRLDPFALLGVAEDASPNAVGTAFVEFARRFAPWQLGAEEAERATTLLLAAARAYATLSDASLREEVLARRRPRATVPVARPGPETDRIRTDLLDPVVQFARGMALVKEGRLREAVVQLEYASDLDPQNADYRTELARCRFLNDPERVGELALEELQDVLRIERNHPLALFYSGEIHQRLGQLELARSFYERAIKPMSGDRRPIDALKALSSARK